MEGMRSIIDALATGVEGAAALLIALGALEAFLRTFRVLFRSHSTMAERKDVWLHFARMLVLGLEFELAADIMRTAISPSWSDIGQLGAIAAIRTFLNFFLERDMDAM